MCVKPLEDCRCVHAESNSNTGRRATRDAITFGHIIALRILPPHTIAAHCAALSNSQIYWHFHQFWDSAMNLKYKRQVLKLYFPLEEITKRCATWSIIIERLCKFEIFLHTIFQMGDITWLREGGRTLCRITLPFLLLVQDKGRPSVIMHFGFLNLGNPETSYKRQKPQNLATYVPFRGNMQVDSGTTKS